MRPARAYARETSRRVIGCVSLTIASTTTPTQKTCAGLTMTAESAASAATTQP